MFVTNWISTTKIQKISEITNFFRHYFLSRTEVYYSANEIDSSTQRSRIFRPTKSNLPPSAVVSLTQRSHIYRLNETYELVK